MWSLTLLMGALATFPLAIAFLVVGGRIHRRSRLEAQPPLAFFAAFWVGVGIYGLAEAVWIAAWFAGFATLPLALFVLHLKIVASVGGFAGLVAYLLTIRGVDRRIVATIFGSYVLVLALVETFYSWRSPIGQEPGAWGMRLVYEQNATQPWWTIVLLVLFVPPLLSAVSYALLLRHVAGPAQRYRIALTSASLLLFFLPVLLSWRAGGFPWWGAVEKLLSALMAMGVVLALWPPERTRRWLATLPTVERRERDAALVRRATELV
jgi:hypothetical protein